MSFLRNNELLNIVRIYRSTSYSSNFDSILQYSKASGINNYIRTFSVENTQVRELFDSDSNQAEHLFQKIEDDQRRFGYVTSRQINLMHSAISKYKLITPGQSLFLLRCCGNLANMEPVDWRKKTVLSILHTYNKLDFQLDISHYNMLLQVNLDNGFSFNPDEILQDLEEKGIEPNRVTYGRLIDQYCQNGDIEGSNKILELMKEKNFSLTEDIFNSLILGNAKMGDLEGALSILETMKQCQLIPGPRTYAVLLQAHVENGDIDGMFKSMADNEEFLYSGKAYLDLIPILSRKGLAEHIPKVLSKLQNLDRWAQYANGVIVKLSDSGEIDVAMQLIEALPNHNGRRFSFFINSMCNAKMSTEKILEYCGIMRTNGINMYSFEIALRELLSRGESNKVMDVLKAMVKEGIPVRSSYLYPLFSIEHASKERKVLLELLDEVKELQLPIDIFFVSNFILPSLAPSNIDEVSKIYLKLIDEVKPQDLNFIYNGMVEYLLKEAKYEIAAGFVNRFKRSLYCNTNRENLLIEMMLSCKDPVHAVSVLRQLLPIHIRVSSFVENEQSERSDNNWEVIGNLLCRFIETLKIEGNLEGQLVPILDTMKSYSVGIGPNKHRIVECLGDFSSADILDSLEFLSNPDLRPVRIETYGFSDVSYIEKKLAHEESEGKETVGLQISLLNNYARGDYFDKAEQLKQKITDGGDHIGPMSQMLLAEMYLRNERLEDAEKMFNLYLEDTKNFKFAPNIIVKYSNALVVADRMDDAIKAILLFSPPQGDWGEMEGRKKDNVYRINLDRLMQNVIRKGDISSLQRMQESLLSRRFGDEKSILQYLVEYHLLKNDLVEALKEFENIAKEHSFTPCKMKMSCALIEQNDIDQLQRIVNVSAKLYGEMSTLYDLVFCFLECGKLEQAEKILKTPGLRTMHDKIDKHCNYLLNKGKMTQLEGVVAVTKNLMQVDRQSLYMHLLNGYITANDADKAVDVWTTMQEEGINSSDEFLVKLSHFLKSKGIDPPFNVSEEALKMHNKQGRKHPVGLENSVQSRKPLVEQEVNVSPLELSPADVETIMGSNQSEQYLSKIKDALVTGKSVRKLTLKTVVQSLSAKGDVDTLLWMKKYIDSNNHGPVTRFNFNLGTAFKVSNRSEDYLNWILSECVGKDETSIDDNRLVSGRVLMDMLKEKEEFMPLFEKCAQEYKAQGWNLLYNILFDYHCSNGQFEDADKVYSDHLTEMKSINLRNCLYTFWNDEDLSRVDTVFDIIKRHPEGREASITYFQTFRIKFLQRQNKIKEAIDVLEESLKTSSIEDHAYSYLIKLKRSAEEQNISFPYSLPDKKPKKKSSSSSSSDTD